MKDAVRDMIQADRVDAKADPYDSCAGFAGFAAEKALVKALMELIGEEAS